MSSTRELEIQVLVLGHSVPFLSGWLLTCLNVHVHRTCSNPAYSELTTRVSTISFFHFVLDLVYWTGALFKCLVTYYAPLEPLKSLATMLALLSIFDSFYQTTEEITENRS
jgi:hypothetical protein